MMPKAKSCNLIKIYDFVEITHKTLKIFALLGIKQNKCTDYVLALGKNSLDRVKGKNIKVEEVGRIGIMRTIYNFVIVMVKCAFWLFM